jgi:mRNA interferase RelE/StbE
MFEVILSPEAREFYAAADKTLARRLAQCFAQLERCFAQLETDPRRHNNIKRLTGDLAGLSRYRVGDWPVIHPHPPQPTARPPRRVEPRTFTLQPATRGDDKTAYVDQQLRPRSAWSAWGAVRSMSTRGDFVCSCDR